MRYSLYDKNNKELKKLRDEHLLSQIISTFEMGKGVVFNLYIGINELGKIVAVPLPWNDADVDGCFSATYLHIARTNIEEKNNTQIIIPYDTDSAIPVYAEWIKKPSNATVGELNSKNNRITIPPLSTAGEYEIRVSAGGLHRLIRLKINS